MHSARPRLPCHWLRSRNWRRSENDRCGKRYDKKKLLCVFVLSVALYMLCIIKNTSQCHFHAQYVVVGLIPLCSHPLLAAATSAAGAPEAAASTGSATGSAAPGQAIWLGQCGQTASYDQVIAGDSEGGSPADETEEGAATAASATAAATPHRYTAAPHAEQNCTWPV